MKQSQLFTKTFKNVSKDDTSVNAQLLMRGDFIYKNSAGIYSYLPLGWRVMQKISSIIREEMNVIGGQEMLMQAMVEKKFFEKSGRWDVPIGFEVKGKQEEKANFVLGWSHEEVLTEIASRFTNSYKDLPFSAYQIQTKFRNEPRAKSGILRTREFLMKDLYSFHADEADLRRFYEEVRIAYDKIYNRCGLKAYYTIAAGGDFTASNTHEFQVASEVGEDTIFACSKCGYAENKEIAKIKAGGNCPKCDGKTEEYKSIEVGNIFPLGTKYSEAFDLYFTDEKGNKKLVVMGSYGIGVGRVMGAVSEIHHDDKGIIWPEEISPFKVHLILIEGKEDKKIKDTADKLYQDLQKKGAEVLYDEREGKTAGEKFADADLIGIPYRAVISEKTVKENKIELKKRGEDKAQLMSEGEFIKYVG